MHNIVEHMHVVAAQLGGSYEPNEHNPNNGTLSFHETENFPAHRILFWGGKPAQFKLATYKAPHRDIRGSP